MVIGLLVCDNDLTKQYNTARYVGNCSLIIAADNCNKFMVLVINHRCRSVNLISDP